MPPPRGRGRGPSKGPPAPPAAPAPPPRPWGPPRRLPSIDPPEVWEGRRLASHPSTTSDVSDAPSLLAMGAPWAVRALAASAGAASAADRSAGAGGGKLQLQGAPSLVSARSRGLHRHSNLQGPCLERGCGSPSHRRLAY